MAPRAISAPTISKGDPSLDFTVTTRKKRVLKCRHLGFVEEYAINSLIGREDSINPTTSLQAQSAAVVREIDGIPWPFPTSKQELMNAMERLERDGFAAVCPVVLEWSNSSGLSEEDFEEANLSDATQA